jgi:hypothetical protein
MERILGSGVLVALLCSAIYASGQDAWIGENRPFSGLYSIYGGELGEEVAPTRNDRKLSIEITGAPAKEMFDSMYPDFQPTCSGEKGDRDRRKGNLYCSYSAGGAYRCFLGYNLRTGKSIAGASC